MKRREDRAEKVIEIDLMKLIRALIVLAMCVLLVISSISFVKGVLRVSRFEITGDSPYEREEIINASGIRPGDKLYGIDPESVEKNIRARCPYIQKVIVKSRFPNKVKIDVTSQTASWYIEIEGDYYALDADLKVLEETVDNKKFIDGGIPRLTLPNIKSAVVGTELVFGDNDSEVRFADEFMRMAKLTTFKSRLTLVDIENRFEIYIQVDGKVNVYMGNTENASVKLKAVETALKDPRLDDCISAEIDASDPSAISVRPVIDYGEDVEG